jgi:DNA-binding CsgD family transcriptional regulator
MGTERAASFVGREAELAAIGELVERTRSGPSRALFVTGDAGVGKSTLLAAALAQRPDATVIGTACPPASDAIAPMAPVAEILRAMVASLPPAAATEVVGADRDDLSVLVPSLGGMPRADGELGRTRLLEAIRSTIERFAALRPPTVIVIEDLHWADASTRDVLAFLAGTVRDAPVLLVGTSRSEDLPVGHPWAAMLRELSRSDRTTRIELLPFGRAEVAAFASASLGFEPGPAVVDALLERSDGNPLFAGELLASGAMEGRRSIPQTVAETMQGRIAGTTPDLQSLLRIAAVIGRSFDDRLMVAMLSSEPAALASGLREAVAQRFLVVREEHGEERFAFRHELLREVAYAQLVPLERRSIHAAVASVLAGLPAAGSDRVGRLAEIAHHWTAAGDAVRAVPALIDAGAAAESIYAFAEAFERYDTALRLWPQAAAAAAVSTEAGQAPRPLGFQMETGARAPAPAVASPFAAERLADLCRRAAEVSLLTDHHERGLELARDVVDDGSGDALLRALDLERVARLLRSAGDVDAALEPAAVAVSLVDGLAPSRQVARVLASQARGLVAAGRLADGRIAAERAIEIASAAGASAEAAEARSVLGLSLAGLGELDAGLDALVAAREEGIGSARPSFIQPRPSIIGTVIHGYADLADVLDRAGRSEDATAITREGAELARRMGVGGTWGRVLETHEAAGLLHLGRWDEAEELSRRLLRSGASGGAAARLLVVRARLEIGRGWFEDAATHLEAATIQLAEHPDVQLAAAVHAARAELAAWRGQLADARSAVDEGLRRIHAHEDPVAALELCWLGLRVEAERASLAGARKASAELAAAHEAAELLHAEAEALSSRFADRARAAPREVRGFGPLAAAEWTRVGRASDPDAWAAAADSWRALRDPALLAYARWREAEAVLEGRSERTRAEVALREAWALASSLAAAPLLREMEDLGRRSRFYTATPDAPAAAAPLNARQQDIARLGLSARELEVLALVAAGRTNRQIAEELFITEKTAGHHVSNVLGKMDATTRVEAAAMAHKLGILDED